MDEDEKNERPFHPMSYSYIMQHTPTAIWKLIAGLDIIDQNRQSGRWKKEITEQADARLQPVYHWGYDKYSKT